MLIPIVLPVYEFLDLHFDIFLPHVASLVGMMLALWTLTYYFASRNFSITMLILLFFLKMLKQINLLRVVHDAFCDNGTIFVMEGTKLFFIA